MTRKTPLQAKAGGAPPLGGASQQKTPPPGGLSASQEAGKASPKSKAGSRYREAGVDVGAGEQVAASAARIAKLTRRPEVLQGPGGFAALCRIPEGYRHPLLVSSTDGVGTKLELAARWERSTHIGEDLVAMCVNDVLVTGAEPLFFLDYYACGTLDPAAAKSILESIARGCRIAGCALVGGETAEMPGIYEGDRYDLAGFCVGVVEEGRQLDGRGVQAGDVLIALASSGPHANGYSLIRRILRECGAAPHTPLEDGTPLGEALLAPTRIYTAACGALRDACPQGLRALAHITGGGIAHNLGRVLTAGLGARLNSASWEWPAVFHWLRQQGRIPREEMRATFNCGIGMIACVSSQEAAAALEALAAAGERAWILGQVEAHTSGQQRIHWVGDNNGKARPTSHNPSTAKDLEV